MVDFTFFLMKGCTKKEERQSASIEGINYKYHGDVQSRSDGLCSRGLSLAVSVFAGVCSLQIPRPTRLSPVNFRGLREVLWQIIEEQVVGFCLRARPLVLYDSLGFCPPICLQNCNSRRIVHVRNACASLLSYTPSINIS